MTTDDQSCDCRGVLDRLDRIIELLEDRKAKREGEDDAGNGRPMPADGEVIRAEGHEDLKFATGVLCKLCQLHDFIGIYCDDGRAHDKCDDVCKYCSQPCHCECHRGSPANGRTDEGRNYWS